MSDKRNLIKKSENISEWYIRVLQEAELTDYGPVKGTMIIRPFGYALWENLQKAMDKEIKDRGVENAYFPLFIPESFLKREKEHVEGFAPEVAVVTYAGGEELSEKIVVRPTSETIMYDSYSKWVESYRDLPILINQWNNVVRWEKRTLPFLRTSEFLWQEGHTAHATHEESWDMVVWGIRMYEKMYKEVYAIPGIVGRKSEAEKFAGADATLTFETIMPDGKALQSCTSHDLGQNFAKSFGIQFQDKEGKNEYVWQTSWGFSTRSIGGLILTHGDDNGLRLPPNIAPLHIVILPVKTETVILDYCKKIEAILKAKGLKVKIDDRDDERIGYKINKWEVKGIPIRLEVGQKEVDTMTVTAARRDLSTKETIELQNIENDIPKLLESIQNNMYEEACKILKQNIHEANSYDEFKKILEEQRGFIKVLWCGEKECEKQIKEETKASSRCLPLDSIKEDGQCFKCGKEAHYRWFFAQAY